PLPVGWARKALLPALVTARVTLFDRSPAVDCWCHCSRETATTWAILPVVTVISSGVGDDGSMNAPSSTNWASASFTHGMRATGASPSSCVVTTVDARRMSASGTASAGLKMWRSGLNESGVFGVVIGLTAIVGSFSGGLKERMRPPYKNVDYRSSVAAGLSDKVPHGGLLSIGL